MTNYFEMILPLNGNFTTTVRLAVGGVASTAGLNVDDCEDFKVCITEALLVFKRNGIEDIKVRFEMDKDELTATVSPVDESMEKTYDDPENEISYALLGALVDEVSFEGMLDPEKPSLITLKKKI